MAFIPLRENRFRNESDVSAENEKTEAEIIRINAQERDIILLNGVSAFSSDHCAQRNPPVREGTVVHISNDQIVLLVEKEKVIDYNATPGRFEIKNFAFSSLLHGTLPKESRETFQSMRYRGLSPVTRDIAFISLKEIEGLKFGTSRPVDAIAPENERLQQIRFHGTFNLRIVDPFLFFQKSLSWDMRKIEKKDLNRLLRNDILKALPKAVTAVLASGHSPSLFETYGDDFQRHMGLLLDRVWEKEFGLKLSAITISEFSCTEKETLPSDREETAKTQGDGTSCPPDMPFNRTEETAATPSEAVRQEGWMCNCGRPNPSDHSFCPSCGQPRPVVVCEKCAYGLPSGIPAFFCPRCGSSLAGGSVHHG